MEDVIQSINRGSDASLVRKLSDNLMIRNGKFGDYIFYPSTQLGFFLWFLDYLSVENLLMYLHLNQIIQIVYFGLKYYLR